MSWDGSGNFSRTNGTHTGSTTWADDRDAGTKIRADRHDTHDQDLADGIAACLTQNNESKPTAHFLPNVDATYNLGSGTYQWDNAYVVTLHINGVQVTSTAAELNILDGVTSTAAELNILDGVTATYAELNYNAGVTPGTVSASKTVMADANKDVIGFRNVTWSGTATGDLAGTASNASQLDSQDPSYYLSRTNHTGTQTLSTISDAGALAALDTVGSAQLASDLSPWILIDSVSCSSSAASFTSLDSTYDIFKIVFWNVKGAATGAMSVRFGNGSYASTGYAAAYVGGTTGTNILLTNIDSGSGSVFGEITIYNPSGAVHPMLFFNANNIFSSYAESRSGYISNSSVSVIDRITFYEGATNGYATGEFRLYGLKK